MIYQKSFCSVKSNFIEVTGEFYVGNTNFIILWIIEKNVCRMGRSLENIIIICWFDFRVQGVLTTLIWKDLYTKHGMYTTWHSL